MMDTTTLAYLAGAMDSDGYISLHERKVGKNRGYEERLGLNQVTPQIPNLLKETFGGQILYYASSTPNARKMYRYAVQGYKAAEACEALYPYLRIKCRQAEILIEFNKTREPQYRKQTYWFKKDFPNWQELEMITTEEVVRRLEYAGLQGVGQAIHTGILLALPATSRNSFTPRIPRLLVERIEQSETGRILPPELLAWRQRLWDEIKVLNKIGIS